MGFLDDLGESVASVAKEVGSKAKDIGETTKIHANIKAEEVKIQEQYYKLGKKYYSLYKDAPDLGLEDFVDAITISNEKIAEYRAELEEKKD